MALRRRVATVEGGGSRRTFSTPESGKRIPDGFTEPAAEGLESLPEPDSLHR